MVSLLLDTNRKSYMVFQNTLISLTFDDLEHQVQGYENFNTNISKTNGLIMTKFHGQFTYHPRMTPLNFKGRGSKVKVTVEL